MRPDTLTTNPSSSIASTSFRVIPMLVSASAVSISGPRITMRSMPSRDRIFSASASWTNARPGRITTGSSTARSRPRRSSTVIRQAISFGTGMTGTSDPQEDRITSMNGVAILPLITLARFVTRGSFASRSVSYRIANGEPISGSQRGVPDIFMLNFFLRSVIISRND